MHKQVLIMDTSHCKPMLNFDSKYVIIAFMSDLKVFAIRSGECVQTLKYHSKPIISIKQNNNNDLQIFSCSTDGVVVRWDYIEGKMLQVYNLHMEVSCFYVPTPSGSWFVTKKYEDHYRLYSLVAKSKGCSNVERIMNPVLPKENSISFGCMPKFCASIFGNTLTIYKFEKKNIIRHKTGERNLTCVVCHPSDAVLATGDDHGRVLIWSNALESNHPIRSLYHWHTLPLADLAFSSEGSHLYSGGGEAALVKWNLFSEEKFVLPRMGAPIAHICASKDNKYVVTAHHDNALQVIDSQRTIVAVIQGLTKCQPQDGRVLPTGLLYNSHLKALVMNGKPGHLQFYNLKQDKQLFNLDIAGKNFISQDRYSTVFNIDVQKAAMDDSGLWLATVEYWSNGDTSPQIWLKFWLFDLEKQTFVLNTNVTLPHNKELSCILFRPHVADSPLPRAVTTSADGLFKIWALTENSSDFKQTWSCESMGCYRDLPAGEACFSEDGSVLAVVFKNVATLWDMEKMIQKHVLLNDHSKDIKQLLFGHHACCHYLVCQDAASITAWNVLTLSIMWVAQNEVQQIAVDPFSTHFAAFLKSQDLIIFSPDNPSSSRFFERVSETPVLSAIFVPAERKDSCLHECSELIFINSDQNLITVSEPESEEEEAEISESRKKIVQNTLDTPFGLLQAAHKVSSVKQVEPENLLSIDNHGLDKNIITSSQNPVALCASILTKLLTKKLPCSPRHMAIS